MFFTHHYSHHYSRNFLKGKTLQTHYPKVKIWILYVGVALLTTDVNNEHNKHTIAVVENGCLVGYLLPQIFKYKGYNTLEFS